MATEEGKPSAKAKPGLGLSREDRKVLLNHHMLKIREASGAVDVARAPFDEAKERLTAMINAAKHDLGKGYTRKRLLSYLEDAQSRLRDLLREEQQRFEDRIDLGLPVWGQQMDMFGGENTPEEVKDELFWEAEGYLVGRRAGDRKAPDGCAPRMEPSFLKGYDKGNAENAPLQKEAADLIAKRTTPDASAKPVDLNGSAQDDSTSLDPDVIADKARKLKGKGFVTPKAAANGKPGADLKSPPARVDQTAPALAPVH